VIDGVVTNNVICKPATAQPYTAPCHRRCGAGLSHSRKPARL